MARNTRRCPNCGASSPSDRCPICGHSLAGGQVKNEKLSGRGNAPSGAFVYDPGQGEDELLMRGFPVIGVLVFALFILLVGGVLFGLFVVLADDGSEGDSQLQQDADAGVSGSEGVFITSTAPGADASEGIFVTSTASPTEIRFPTNTRAAPMLLPTVTPVPVTDTPTPTQEACIQTAAQGDSVYGMALRCGHSHLSIVQVIVEQNNSLDCETCLREGQTLEIPWPTPTPASEGSTILTIQPVSEDDVDTQMAVSENMEAAATPPVNEQGTPDQLATLFVEPTLRPGLMWHSVGSGETMISVASQYGATAKVLSDLNPEIEFLQCDFGKTYGGENCTVMIFEGQRMRVPAPTPTPTIPPTASGSETPTPSPTATFNVPQAFRPADGASFDRSSLITLRWSSSGTLGSNEVYLIEMENLNTGEAYIGESQELLFVVPDAWQPDGGTQTFEWTVAVATLNEQGEVIAIRERTSPRQFDWEG